MNKIHQVNCYSTPEKEIFGDTLTSTPFVKVYHDGEDDDDEYEDVDDGDDDSLNGFFFFNKHCKLFLQEENE